MISDVIRQLNIIMWELKTVYYRQDNACWVFVTAASLWCVVKSSASSMASIPSARIFRICKEARSHVTGRQQQLSRTWGSTLMQATLLRHQRNERCHPFEWWSTCLKRCLVWVCGSTILHDRRITTALRMAAWRNRESSVKDHFGG